MKKQRETLLADFRKKIHDDDITKLVLMQRQENHKVERWLEFFIVDRFSGIFIGFIC